MEVKLSDFDHLRENLDCRQCVLVQFPNSFDEAANPLISIGYLKWIIDEKVRKDVESLSSQYIKKSTCTSMMWPTGCNVEPANNKSFKNKLKNCYFEVNSVQILSYGSMYDYFYHISI